MRFRPEVHASQRSRKGAWAEQVARDYLEARGLLTIRRNFRSRYGEIDLIMEDKGWIVFVEVRYRRGNFMSGEESVDERKRQRILRTGEYYLSVYHDGPQIPVCRFDVVAVTGPMYCPRYRWIRDAFQG